MRHSLSWLWPAECRMCYLLLLTQDSWSVIRSPSPTPHCSTEKKKQFLSGFQSCSVRFNSSSVIACKFKGFLEYALCHGEVACYKSPFSANYISSLLRLLVAVFTLEVQNFISISRKYCHTTCASVCRTWFVFTWALDFFSRFAIQTLKFINHRLALGY